MIIHNTRFRLLLNKNMILRTMTYARSLRWASIWWSQRTESTNPAIARWRSSDVADDDEDDDDGAEIVNGDVELFEDDDEDVDVTVDETVMEAPPPPLDDVRLFDDEGLPLIVRAISTAVTIGGGVGGASAVKKYSW
jgi:hypothetical protein